MAARVRTFVAIDVAPGVRHAIQREMPKLMAAAPHFNWVKVENFHFTLSFLGEVHDRELPEICNAIHNAVQSIEEFELEIVGLSAFPSSNRIKYVWAGVGHGKEELCQLQAAVANAANRLGFPRDRDVYTPHLTIARAARNGASQADILSVLEPLGERSFGVCSIDEVVIYASLLERQGPTYVPMSTISLSY
jgi:RNA 2',3'-cyclic 3'-phosphodiesterase